jgi:SAM-dependent methyltransferase
MPDFKDLFSIQASDYAKYRPSYPPELFEYLKTLVNEHHVAWDAGTGNGQAAVELAKFFERVIATDPSEKQLKAALPRENISYLCEPAEAPSFSEKVNLVTVAQAFHWFRHADFAEAVKKISAKDCHLVVWSYAITCVGKDVDPLVEKLYNGLLGPFWEKERLHVENGYRKIEMPFQEITAPKMNLKVQWTKEQFSGYLKTWSALQTYLKSNAGEKPAALLQEIEKAFGNDVREVSWPLNMRVWKI